MKLNIDPLETPANWGAADTAPALEIYADVTFDTSDSKTVLAGNVELGDFRHRVVGSVLDEVATFPPIIGIYSTEDSLTNQMATYTAYIRLQGREPIPYLERFRIPPLTRPEMTSTSWTRLRIHNQGVIPRGPGEEWKIFVLSAIEAAIGQQTKAGLATLVDGEVEVPNSLVTINSKIAPFSMDENVTGSLRATVADIIEHESFVIRSTNDADEGRVGWIMID